MEGSHELEIKMPFINVDGAYFILLHCIHFGLHTAHIASQHGAELGTGRDGWDFRPRRAECYRGSRNQLEQCSCGGWMVLSSVPHIHFPRWPSIHLRSDSESTLPNSSKPGPNVLHQRTNDYVNLCHLVPDFCGHKAEQPNY